MNNQILVDLKKNENKTYQEHSLTQNQLFLHTKLLDRHKKPMFVSTNSNKTRVSAQLLWAHCLDLTQVKSLELSILVLTMVILYSGQDRLLAVFERYLNRFPSFHSRSHPRKYLRCIRQRPSSLDHRLNLTELDQQKHPKLTNRSRIIASSTLQSYDCLLNSSETSIRRLQRYEQMCCQISQLHD